MNIAELKNHLTVYLNEVKAGKEILVLDGKQPVAGIVPMTRSRDDEDELRVLASQGKLRLGEGYVEDTFWEMPAPTVPAAAVRHTLERERYEG